ncbi:DoxX family protein [Streptomyces sp. NPDC047002]|uniref:DoxX family protein n=1 Tax=Streptomyces sp. NPDC047002 TaxID=3155475 RepID=UPI0034553356
MSGRLDRAQPYALGLFRIVVGLLFTCHGVATLFGVLGMRAVPVGAWPGWYAAVIQLVGGALVLTGLAARPVALVSSGSMAFAYFSVHQAHGVLPLQNGGEAAVFFCWAFLLITVMGPGALGLGRAQGAARATGGGDGAEGGERPVGDTVAA